MVCPTCRAVFGLAGEGVGKGGRKGEQRGEQWLYHGGLCKGLNENLQFYSTWQGKSLKRFKQENYMIQCAFLEINLQLCEKQMERWKEWRWGNHTAVPVGY